MTPPRVVIDANLHFSAQIGGRRGPVHVLQDAWLNGRVRPLASPEVMADTEAALRKKKLRLPESRIREILAAYRARSEMITPPPGLPVAQCRDPEDQRYLDLAYAAEADALVSGDKDLHAAAGDFPVPVLNARRFLEKFLKMCS